MAPKNVPASAAPASLPDLQAAAAALKDLVRRISDISSETCVSLGDGPGDPDGRDYPAMLALVASSVDADLIGASPGHREGYLRAITDLLCMLADGSVSCDDDWDPIGHTSPAFDALQMAGLFLARAGNTSGAAL